MASIFWLNLGSTPQTQKAMEEHQTWNLKCKGTFVLIKGPGPLPVVMLAVLTCLLSSKYPLLTLECSNLQLQM